MSTRSSSRKPISEMPRRGRNAPTVAAKTTTPATMRHDGESGRPGTEVPRAVGRRSHHMR